MYKRQYLHDATASRLATVSLTVAETVATTHPHVSCNVAVILYWIHGATGCGDRLHQPVAAIMARVTEEIPSIGVSLVLTHQ